MRHSALRRLVMLAALALTSAAHAAAPTKFTANTAEVRDFLAVSSSVGYAATQGGGVWKSTDAGATWSKTSLAAKYTWKIAANTASGGARLYAATDSGLFRSVDAGATWTQLTRDATRAVAVDPNSAAAGPDTILVGVKGAGVLKSTDSGSTLVRRSSGLDATDVIGIVYYPGSSSTAYVAVQCNVDDAPVPLSGNWGGVYRTTNANATPTWTAMNGGIETPDSTVPCVNAIAANGTSVVVGVLNVGNLQGQIYRISSSGASSWTAAASSAGGPPFGVEFLGPDISNANGFFIGSHQFGPWRSTDGGNTFSQVGGTAQGTARTFAVGAFTSSTWMGGMRALGLFRTTDSGSTWTLPSGPVGADRVSDLTNHSAVAPNTYYMAVKNGGVMKSTDAGSTWTEFNTGLPNVRRTAEVIGAAPGNTSVVAVGMRGFGMGLYQLSGSTWSAVSGFAGPVDHKPQAFMIAPNGTAYYSLFDANAATPGGLFRSTITGTTIGTLTSAGIPVFDAAPQLGVKQGSGRVRVGASQTRGFMVTHDSLPYRTADGGATWTVVSSATSGFSRHGFLDLAEKPSTTSTLVASTNKGIFKSTDDGVNWSRVASTGLTQHGLTAMVYTSNNVLWGGDFGGQMWCSVDDGTTWQAVTGGNLGATINEMKLMNGQIHVLTDGLGVWKKDAVCP